LNITGLWLPGLRKKNLTSNLELKTFKWWAPMNFQGNICYGWFPMISGHGSEQLFSMGIEILGLEEALSL